MRQAMKIRRGGGAVTLLGLSLCLCAEGAKPAESGLTGWPSDPSVNVVVCDTIREQSEQVIVADAGGGAFVAWKDLRRSLNDRRIIRLDALGNVASGWPTQGINLTQATSGSFGAEIVRSGENGAIVCWQDGRQGTVILAQRVDTSATLSWPAPGVIVNSKAATELHDAVAMPDGGVVVFYRKDLGFTTDTLYAMRLDASGQRVWAQDLVLCDAVGTQRGTQAVVSSDGQVIVLWSDGRTTPIWTDPQLAELYAQKLGLDGTELWPHNGVRILSPQSSCQDLQPNSAGGFVATCAFSDPGVRSDLKLVNIDGNGAPMPGWPADGLVIANDPGAREGGQPSVSPEDGSILLIWGDGENLSGLKALKISNTGEILWPNGGIALYDSTASLAGWSIAPDGAGGAFVSIEHDLANTDIVAQHVHADGTSEWPGWGVPVTTAPGVQYVSYTVPDSSGGIFVCWRDYRNPATDPDLYAQHVNADGSLGGVVTATEAAAVEAAFDGECARVAWYASDAAGVTFCVQREAELGEWMTLGSASVDGTGRVEHRDCDVQPGATYSYRLEWSDGREVRHTAPIALAIAFAPALALAAPVPNPLADMASFEYTLPGTGHVRLEVLDIAGRRVTTVLDAVSAPGTHRVSWPVRDDSRLRLAPGCYVLRLSAAGHVRVRRFVVLR